MFDKFASIFVWHTSKRNLKHETIHYLYSAYTQEHEKKLFSELTFCSITQGFLFITKIYTRKAKKENEEKIGS